MRNSYLGFYFANDLNARVSGSSNYGMYRVVYRDTDADIEIRRVYRYRARAARRAPRPACLRHLFATIVMLYDFRCIEPPVL